MENQCKVTTYFRTTGEVKEAIPIKTTRYGSGYTTIDRLVLSSKHFASIVISQNKNKPDVNEYNLWIYFE